MQKLAEQEHYQKVEVELEVRGVLEDKLVYTVQPLQEHRAALVGV